MWACLHHLVVLSTAGLGGRRMNHYSTLQECKMCTGSLLNYKNLEIPAFTGMVRAVFQILVFHHKHSSDLKTLTVKVPYLEGCFYCLLLH